MSFLRHVTINCCEKFGSAWDVLLIFFKYVCFFKISSLVLLINSLRDILFSQADVQPFGFICPELRIARQ